MLHDVGKIAISDLILKKPAGLDAEEFNIMKYHTILGARLFQNDESELDTLSGEMTLDHHEKWGGHGYPGRIADIFDPQVTWARASGRQESPDDRHRRRGGRLRRPGLGAEIQGASAGRADPENRPGGIRPAIRPGGRPAFLEVHDTTAAIKEKYRRIRLAVPGVPQTIALSAS